MVVAFVRRCIEEHDGKDVQVPHAIDASEEGAVHLHRVLSPVPVALINLDTDKGKIHLFFRRQSCYEAVDREITNSPQMEMCPFILST